MINKLLDVTQFEFPPEHELFTTLRKMLDHDKDRLNTAWLYFNGIDSWMINYQEFTHWCRQNNALKDMEMILLRHLGPLTIAPYIIHVKTARPQVREGNS